MVERLSFWLCVGVVGMAVFSRVTGAQQGAPGSGTQGSSAASETRSKEGLTKSEMAKKRRESTSMMKNPLSGAMEFRPGSAREAHSYLVPSLHYTGYADTNSAGLGVPATVDTRSVVVGDLALQRVWSHAQLTLDYAGGGFLYGRRYGGNSTAPLPVNGTMHRASIFQTFSGRHWEVLFGDEGFYLPESPFGFSGFGGVENLQSRLGETLGGGGRELSPLFTPNQTILTGRSRRVSNSSVVELQYNPGARSAITATATYGVLSYLDQGFFDSSYVSVLTGYNHAITRRDSVSLTYAHYWLRFKGTDREVLNRGLVLGYGRRITGRLALQLSAGSLVNMVSKPLGGSTTHAFWSTSDSLVYNFNHGTVTAYFSRYLTGGSGVLPGAESDLAQLSASRLFRQKYQVSINAGHAFNQSLTQDRVAGQRFKFETWQGGFNLSRRFGRNTDIYVNYYFQRQISNNPFCFGSDCATVVRRHVGGIGIDWHTQPIKID